MITDIEIQRSKFSKNWRYWRNKLREQKNKQGREYVQYKRHKLSLDDYTALVIAQDNKCAICSEYKSGKVYDRLHVDHNHTTGQVRGLLCTRCNTMLGMGKDDARLLDNGAAYLRKWKALEPAVEPEETIPYECQT